MRWLRARATAKDGVCMTRILRYAIGLVLAFGLGYMAAPREDAVLHAQNGHQKAAYLIASTKVLKPDQMSAYGKAAGPLAKQAGLQVLARGQAGSTIQLLEGKWPYEGGVVIERFRSMKDLLAFWHSPGYQDAKKLREGATQVNFIVAVEAVD
jgi:uncharacterized protein (DUF1330 family)